MPRGQFDRSARSAQTRAKLLEAAAAVYARRGFAGATLDEVASEAGFTKGAVYGHFGSKEKLLLALLAEHLAGQVAEQVQLFDRERSTWERPFVGSERWMNELGQHPERFRLFVELWAQSQRDEYMREQLAGGLVMLRSTFARFAADSAIDSGFEGREGIAEQFASVMLGLTLGLSLLKLSVPEAVSNELLGTTLSALIRAAEDNAEVQDAFVRLAGVASSAADLDVTEAAAAGASRGSPSQARRSQTSP